MNQPTIVEVAVPLPVDQTYNYTLGAGQSAQPGMRVLVPYRGRQVAAVVLAVGGQPSSGAKAELRGVLRVLDPDPVLSAELLDVLLSVARECLCSPGIALAAAVPSGTAPRILRRVSLLENGRRALQAGEARGEIGRVLWSLGKGPIPEARLRRRIPGATRLLAGLERIGWIAREVAEAPPRVQALTRRVYRIAPDADLQHWRERLARAPRRLEILERLALGPVEMPAGAPLRALVKAGAVLCEDREVSRVEVPPPLRSEERPPQLTPHQHEAVVAINAAIGAGRDASFLLHGITGSGKTEVYLRSVEYALDRGRGAIVLVPEISLTHQIVDRFRARFGDRVAVLHSGLSAGERFDQWRRIRSGAHPIAIGARSAIFAPVAELGFVAIDEEHDSSYKSEEGFRYHARRVAELRARAAGCPLVLGSATPAVETMFRAQVGDLELLELPLRVESRPLPRVEIVDMRVERAQRGRRPLLSRTLRAALTETLAAGQQTILFINRRGFATMTYCFTCGHTLRCQNCDISLVYHTSGGRHREDAPEQGELRCHYCGHREAPQPLCPACRSPEGALFGLGTERIQEEVGVLFPRAHVLRLDRDTSARKGAQREILAAFYRGEADVLVGTQMVAKGHDVPGVTLVGVIAADLGLHFPDFRAAERTFQLLTQVAGRAGRGRDSGRVVVQTFLPRHYAIACARTHDYPGFYAEELSRREPHGYPPFRALVQVSLSGAEAAAVEAAANTIAGLAKTVLMSQGGGETLEILGPAPAPVSRVRGQFRWQLLLLGDSETLRAAAQELRRLARRRFSGVTLRVVLDPVQML